MTKLLNSSSVCFAAAALIWLLAGCVGSPQHPAMSGLATETNLATTRPTYWYSQPPQGTVHSDDFYKLWYTCEGVARSYLFNIDRSDFRGGVLITEPLVSSQWFEPWRRDARGIYQAEESTIATMRRTIRFEFTREISGGWTVAPKVLVEKQEISEKRITTVTRFMNVFAAPLGVKKAPYGTAESDLGIDLPERYWYPIRRDPLFEQAITSAVEHDLQRQTQ